MSEMLVSRERYLERLRLFRGRRLVKVVTGVRRCGKSSLLALLREELRTEGISENRIVSLNLEGRGHGVTTADDLYQYCASFMHKTETTYVFIDEIQRIENWHDAINALRVDFNCDIYVTGSNAFLLSSELATYLSGRYVEIHVQPLVFDEYLDFLGVSVSEDKKLALYSDGTVLALETLLNQFLLNGGLPALAQHVPSESEHSIYCSSLYESVLVRDITSRERHASNQRISDSGLLRLLASFLADNIGNTTSAKKISDTLTSSGAATTNKTITSYMRALNDAYLFYPVSRFDLHGKALLRTLPKQYITDLGLRSFLTGYRATDTGRVFENAVYLQLKADAWNIHVGKLYSREIDFVCLKDGKTAYVQVADNLYGEETLERELKPLKALKDNYDKLVIVREGTYPPEIDGICILPATDYLLSGL